MALALRGQKEVAVAVAVLRGPPCPPRTKVLPLQFFAALRGPSWTNVLPLPFFVVLRGPSRTNVLPLQFSAALRVLRGQMCCRCSSPRPSVSSADKCVAVAVLRGPSWPFVDKCVAVAVLRAALRGPSWTKVLPLQFSAALRVLRGQRCCRCSSSRPFVALRGQMCCRCRSSWSFVALRGQMCCRCSSPRPSVSSADKGVAVAVLRGPPWLDQFMIPLISVQTNVNEP